MKYFTLLPSLDYQFPDGKFLPTKNIFIRPNIKIAEEFDANSNKFMIEDAKSPDNVAKEFYSDPNLFWSLLLTNNIIDYYKDWPLSYSDWEQEQYKVNSEFTIYSKYIMDIEIGDLVCKYLPGENINFDRTNFGVVTAFDSFYRTFDVNMAEGELKKNDQIIVLRKNGLRYDIINTPNGEESQTILKIIQKLESAFLFEKKDDLSGYYGGVSPYYSINGEIIDDVVTDLSLYTGTVLWRYINDSLPNNYKITTFKQNKENEWTFRRNLTVIPKTKVNQVLTASISSIENQKAVFE
jgi:hypothetical protein